jgi:predicted ABC-type ATPase
LPWFLDKADDAWIFDNSGASPRRIAQKRKGVITLETETLPEIAALVRKIRGE